METLIGLVVLVVVLVVAGLVIYALLPLLAALAVIALISMVVAAFTDATFWGAFLCLGIPTAIVWLLAGAGDSDFIWMD